MPYGQKGQCTMKSIIISVNGLNVQANDRTSAKGKPQYHVHGKIHVQVGEHMDNLPVVIDGQAFLTTKWELSTIPGVAVIITALGLSLIGDGLADLLRPE